MVSGFTMYIDTYVLRKKGFSPEDLEVCEHVKMHTKLHIPPFAILFILNKIIICLHVQYMIFLEIQLTLINIKQLIFPLIFKLFTVLWKLHCTCVTVLFLSLAYMKDEDGTLRSSQSHYERAWIFRKWYDFDVKYPFESDVARWM